MLVELLIKKFFQSCSAWTGFILIHDKFVDLSVANDLLDQVFVCQVSDHCIDQQRNNLMSATNAVVIESARIHHLALKAQNFEKPIFIFGCFPLKAVYNSCKLRRLLRDAKFFIMYSFTHTNILSLSKSSKFLVLQFLLICCKLNSVFKFLSKSHISF